VRLDACQANQSERAFTPGQRLDATMARRRPLPLSIPDSAPLRLADRFAGKDAGAQIAAAIADLPPGGGVVDARGIRGAGQIPRTVTIAKRVTLLLPAPTEAELVSTADPAFDVHDASGVRIYGGKLVLSGRGASAVTYTGTVSDLLLQGMTVKGSGNPADGQKGFHCQSGQTLSDLRILDNTVESVTIGISLNADLGGAIAGARIEGNLLTNIVGTAPGQGYGIHHSNGSGNPSGVRIAGNFIALAQRHSIYQARGAGVVIEDNVIVRHRQGVSTGDQRPAISVLRSTDVVVKGNVIDDPWDGAIDANGGVDAMERRITLEDNLVRNWHAFPALAVGSRAPAREGAPVDVAVRANRFVLDAIGAAPVALLIRNGRRLRISHNQFSIPISREQPDAIAIERSGDPAGTGDVELIGNCISTRAPGPGAN
jgi:parallel beta helix pectate lyase-like protein